MGLARRQIRLTLSRWEWEEIARTLAACPESAAVSASAVRDLQGRIAACRRRPYELVTFSQSALSWAPLMLALSFQVQRDSRLQPLAEHLQSQIQMQVKRFEGPVRGDSLQQSQNWIVLKASGFSRRLSPN